MSFDLSKAKTEVQAVVADWVGIDLTSEQVDEILADPHVLGQVIPWGVQDTETRSAVVNFLAKKITGRSWPLNGEDEASKTAFLLAYEQGAEAKGYKLKRKS